MAVPVGPLGLDGCHTKGMSPCLLADYFTDVIQSVGFAGAGERRGHEGRDRSHL